MTADSHDGSTPPTLPGDLCGLYAELAERVAAELDTGHEVDEEELLQRYSEHADLVRQFVPFLKALHQAGYQGHEWQAADAEHLGAIGDYRILREIGRGGMGAVYLAQKMSLNRRVALKILPFAAVLEPTQLQRFKNEAQAAAILSHPHIVDVFDFGCERGVYFYAMRYIEGWSLADVVRQLQYFRQDSCRGLSDSVEQLIKIRAEQEIEFPAAGDDADHRSASVTRGNRPTGRSSRTSSKYHRSIAALVADVADALAHAHGQGIIHRDIKPSNLLLDVQGKVWVADFGLAQVQSNPALTMTGSLLGTLRYMSPEQAMAKRIPIDHRTDIYSLGATLYELLTLQHAIHGSDSKAILQELSFHEPRAPRRLDNSIPSDLETIVLKAMAKNPTDRYGDCQEMAADLRRFLDHQPIQARRQGIATKTIKWAQRHPGTFSTIALATLAVVLAAVGYSLTLMTYAGRLERQRDLLAAEKGRAVLHQKQAEHYRDLAVYLLSVASRDDQTQEQLQAKLELPTDDLERLREALHGDVGATAVSHNLSAIADTLSQLDQLSDTTRGGRLQQGRLLLRLAELNAAIGLLGKADERYGTGMQMLEELAADYPDDFAIAANVVWGKINFGLQLNAHGRYIDALPCLESAVEDAQHMVDRDGENVDCLYALAAAKQDLAVIKLKLGDPEAATTNYRQIMPSVEQLLRASTDPRYIDLAASIKSNLADVYRSRGMLDEAVGVIQSAIAIYQDSLKNGKQINRQRMHYVLGQAFFTQAKIYEDLGQTEKAEAAYRKSLQSHEQGVEEFPQDDALRQSTAGAHQNLGLYLQSQERFAPAESEYLQAIEQYKSLLDQAPQSPICRSNLAGAYAALAGLYDQRADAERAAHFFEMAIQLRGTILALAPDSVELRHAMAVLHNNIVGPYMQQGKSAEALDHLNEAIRLHGRNARECPHVVQFQLDLANSLLNRSMAYRDLQRTDAARESLTEATKIITSVGQAQPNSASVKHLEDFAKRIAASLQ